jgi:HK97 family phage portal protein
LATLPFPLYKRTGDNRDKVKSRLATILHDAANDEMSSFEWRKYTFEQVFTGGRAFTFIERNGLGEVINLWPLNPSGVTIKRDNGRKVYTYRDGGRTVTYSASEIIDIPFMLRADGISHRGPVTMGRDAIALCIAATQFGSKFFDNGGVPPFAVTGNFQSGKSMERASEDFRDAVRQAAKDKRQALVLPAGLEIKSIGTDAEKSQLVELKRFGIEEVARLYSLPPIFLQDLTHGTFSNSEQQDLHLVKHTATRWAVQFEQEVNLKLFGRASNKLYAELNMDGLLRGDFKTRMEGYAQGVQNGILKPNEARRKENLPNDDDGEKLMIQGATVPIATQAAAQAGNQKGADNAA